MATFKERLQQEHPECVFDDGSCAGCPEGYGYEGCIICNGMDCEECWNREMEEEGEHYDRKMERNI